MNFVVGDVLVAASDTGSFRHVKKDKVYTETFVPCEGNFILNKDDICMVVKSIMDGQDSYVIAYVIKENSYIYITLSSLQIYFSKL